MIPGFVRVSVKGQQCQRFVNLCRGREMDLKRIIRTGETELQLTMKVADFLQISPLRRKTGVHIHILKKRGPLFFLLFCKRRKIIPAGFLAVFCLLFFLSGRVWNVEIRGNILNPTPQLMSFLKEQGVCFGVSRKKISCSALAASLRREFPEITWVSAGFSGTGLRFDIREGTAGEKAEPEERACSLFSTLDGVVDSMVTRQGTPLVRAGDEIKKGQELVSGIVDITDDSQEVIRYAYVQADADIYIRHTIAYYDTFPLNIEKKVWSGKKKTRLFFQLGNWFLDFSSPLKENEERLVSREPLFSIGIFRSPVTLGIAAIGKYEVQKEQLTEDAIAYLVETAKENAALLSPEDCEELYAGEESYPELEGVNAALEELRVEEKINAAMRMETAALAGAEEVASLDYCALGTSLAEVVIRNTRGLDVSFAKNFATAYVSAIAKKGGETKTGSYFWKAQDWNDFNPEETGRMAAKRAASHLGAVSVPSGKYDVIFDGRAMVSLLGAFAGVFFAENAQKGFSLLQGKTGEKIASEGVTLRDDALLLGGYGTQPFDSEGVSGKNKAVIENGVLKTLLHNRRTAKKDGVASTGNGFKMGLTGSVKTAPTNFYLAKGMLSQEALLAQMGDGLLLTSLMGLHAGTNAVSGDFSLSAEGFRIKGGRIDTPVEQITVAGNFYQLLAEVEEIADDLYFGSGGVGSPSVLIRGLAIAGS